MAMASRSKFLIQLLQKMGAPLMGAVNAHDKDGDAGAAARTMASLLSESVKVGISLSQAMNLKTEDGDADAIRVALSSLGAHLIGQSYRDTGRIPSDADAQKISKTLESVILFADNFAPAAEHTQRLMTLEETPPFFDPVQTSLYSMHALLPVIAAVGSFSFGQSEARLVQDIADRLTAKAKEIQEQVGGPSDKMSELLTLQALASLYASCHRAQIEQLRTAGEQAQSGSLDTVWANFDTQAAMLQVLLGAMTDSGSSVQSGGGSGGGVKPQMSATPAAPAATGGSPMSFFKKK